MHLGPLTYRGDKLVNVPGLRQIAVDAPAIDRFDERIDVAVAGQDDANEVGIRLCRVPDQLGPGHFGHALIDDGDRDLRMRRENLERGRAGRSGEHLELLTETDAQQLDARRFIVDDQDGRSVLLRYHLQYRTQEIARRKSNEKDLGWQASRLRCPTYAIRRCSRVSSTHKDSNSARADRGSQSHADKMTFCCEAAALLEAKV